MSTEDDFPELDIEQDAGTQNDPPFPPGPQPGYDPGMYPPGYGTYIPPRPYSQLAIWSIVLSGLGLMCCGITSIPGIITGHLSLGRIKRSQNQLDGRVLAIIGVVLGYVMIVFVLLYILFVGAMVAIPFMSDDWRNMPHSSPPRQQWQVPSQPRQIPEPPFVHEDNQSSGQEDSSQPPDTDPPRSQGKNPPPDQPSQ